MKIRYKRLVYFDQLARFQKWKWNEGKTCVEMDKFYERKCN